MLLFTGQNITNSLKMTQKEDYIKIFGEYMNKWEHKEKEDSPKQ